MGTLTTRISTFIPKAITRVRALQSSLTENYDPTGYQANSKELLMQIGETYNFIDLLYSYNYSGLTEKQVSDLIDFFIVWLDLNKVTPVSYSQYELPTITEIVVSNGTYATVADLQGEILARIAADSSLSARILALETAGPGGSDFPPGFFDNHIATYTVVFDDDPRLHTHANKALIDALNAADIDNIKALGAHFASKGNPGGDHVSAEDRVLWNAGGGGPGSPDTYNLTSPSTVEVGGAPVGTVLTGRTWQSIMEEILVDYLSPYFSSQGMSGQAPIIEVGVALSGNKTFVWATVNSLNVAANSIVIRDVTGAVDLATAQPNDGVQIADIGVIVNTAPIIRQWRIEAVNTNAVSFFSALIQVQSIHPYFWGKVASGGAVPGSNRPAANQALINSGTKVVADSNGNFTVNFGSGSDDYIWFAIPASAANRLSWFVTALNTGAIGGAVSPGGNLFPDAVVMNVDSPGALWTGVSYKIYIANYQTTAALAMLLKNT